MMTFSLVFAYSYSVNRRPEALMTVYALTEGPLWWCLLAPLGSYVFATYFIARFVLSIVALAIEE